jgi:hypothetical protein
MVSTMEASAHLFWRRVSADLQIEIISPFGLVLPNGQELTVTALVRNFGQNSGMLVAESYEMIKAYQKDFVDLGYGYAVNIGGSPDEYNRSLMIEILQDWGWSGPRDQSPSWLKTISSPD